MRRFTASYVKRAMKRFLACALVSPLAVTLILWNLTESSTERSVIFTHPEWILYGSLALSGLCFIGVWFERDSD